MPVKLDIVANDFLNMWDFIPKKVNHLGGLSYVPIPISSIGRRDRNPENSVFPPIQPGGFGIIGDVGVFPKPGEKHIRMVRLRLGCRDWMPVANPADLPLIQRLKKNIYRIDFL